MGKTLNEKMLLTCTFGTTDVQKISTILKSKKGKKLTSEQRNKFSIYWRKPIIIK